MIFGAKFAKNDPSYGPLFESLRRGKELGVVLLDAGRFNLVYKMFLLGSAGSIPGESVFRKSENFRRLECAGAELNLERCNLEDTLI